MKLSGTFEAEELDSSMHEDNFGGRAGCLPPEAQLAGPTGGRARIPVYGSGEEPEPDSAVPPHPAKDSQPRAVSAVRDGYF